ncbi:MAG: hypothetical protein IGS23_06305 [Rivularia sp. T60_A2020_040]|nr:hypothetical protein [Rivularia sp. T60_A2020_040]
MNRKQRRDSIRKSKKKTINHKQEVERLVKLSGEIQEAIKAQYPNTHFV